jgi:hypothetical protein
MRGVGTKRQPGEQGKKMKKLELGKKSLKDLVAEDGNRVGGGGRHKINTPHTVTLYVCY